MGRDRRAARRAATAALAVRQGPAAGPSDAALAALSDLIYERHDRIADLAPALGARLARWSAVAHTQAALFHGDGWSAIVFRGTQLLSARSLAEGWHDMRSNFGRAAPWAGPGRAHRGYAAALHRVQDAGLGMLAAARAESGPAVAIGGHSMGGALAALFAALAVAEGRLGRGALVTFGAPAPGDAAAWTPLRRSALAIRRYVIWGDPFVHWPPHRISLTHPGPARRVWSWHPWRHAAGAYARALA